MTIINAVQEQEQEQETHFSMLTQQNQTHQTQNQAPPLLPLNMDHTDHSDLFMGHKERRKSSSTKLQMGDYISSPSSNTSSLSGNGAAEQIRRILIKHGELPPSSQSLNGLNGMNGQVLFADVIIKINKRNKMQERVLLITKKAIYNIDPSPSLTSLSSSISNITNTLASSTSSSSNNSGGLGVGGGTTWKVKRRIPLDKISGVSLSTMPDNFFCVHVGGEYDYLLVSNKKTEIVKVLCQAYRNINNNINININDNINDSGELKVKFSNAFEYKIEEGVYREIMFSLVEGGISTQIFTKKKHK